MPSISRDSSKGEGLMRKPKKSKSMVYALLILAASTTLLSGISFAETIKQQPQDINAQDVDYYEAFLDEAKVNDRMKFKEWMLKNFKDKFGGVYTDENGNFVFGVTDDSLNYERYIQKTSKYATNFVFKKVKFSINELEAAREVVQKFDVRATSINPATNKLEIYISEKSLSENKSDILLAIKDAELVEFHGGSITEELQ
ncbi:hypothetical protein PaecuDRAFT_3937 [Paenibacillus curdlanolyticus YK9]|uniref:Uncharacterized protein n=2 Tax=Paenibacillus curdlanolyticus TaxID=59840 RepID=E0IE46_9BACL|nr:hypothetical protein PaecuDRAFT_3937 [Paenibacillus curdlanolyticus YK9]